MTGERVAIAMSGGVDSSTAAALLREQGYDLVGFSMQLWDQKRQSGGQPEAVAPRCCSLDDLYDARAVAARLGFPYYVVNFHAEFERDVVRTFIQSYRDGSTPSPCVLCNSHMKFAHLVKMADEVQASRVATGHYARVELDRATRRYNLFRGRDAGKDQSYFLFELSQAQLARALFPLGNLDKAAVRRIARKHGLEIADKPESQEICFVPDGDYAAFVERYHDEVVGESDTGSFEPGEIVDSQGNVLGTHRGIHHFTIGQRRGLGVAHSEPLYVLSIEPLTRRVTVGERRLLGRTECRVVRPNWVSVARMDSPLRVQAQIRSRHRAAPALITPFEDGSVRVTFDDPQPGVSPGQACVFYEAEKVVGGGWIARDGASHPTVGEVSAGSAVNEP